MSEEAKIIKDAFAEVLKDKTATVSRKQLIAVLRQLDPEMTEDGLNGLFDYVDKNGNGVIEYTEFVDFICELDEDAPQPTRADLNKERTITQEFVQKNEAAAKMFDKAKWQKALEGGAWAFASDQQASAMRMIVKQFPNLDPTSPEGLTLAEEFVLLWHDRKTGELAQYSYFGSDEPFHNALFGACLIGLQARGCLSFEPKKCKWLGTYWELNLKGSAPTDSEVLKATFDELSSQPDNTLKQWFEQKSGKWGQDETTKKALKALVDRGVFEAGGLVGDAFHNAKFTLKDKSIEQALVKRLRAVTNGEVEADGRSLALLALCRTADQRDPATNTLMAQIFGDDAATMTDKVDTLVESMVSFNGIGAEEINKMIDILPGPVQQEISSTAFKTDAAAQFQELTGGKGKITPKQLAGKIDTMINDLVREKLGIKPTGMEAVIAMFDRDQDGMMEIDGFVSFLMFCHALQCLA